MKKIFFLTYFIFFAEHSWAIKGEYADSKHNLQSVCKIKYYYYQDNKIFNNMCTSSFIGNKSFLTADHCGEGLKKNIAEVTEYPNLPEPQVFCPGQEPLNIIRSDSFKDVLTYDQDLSFFKTEFDAKIPPLKIATSPDEVEMLLEKNECYISGYGLDNDGKHGQLKTAKVLSYSPKIFLGNYNPYLFEITGKNYADNGDSGGPCFCYDQSGNPVLTGALHGSFFQSNWSKYERLTQSNELIDYYLKFDNPNLSNFKKMEIFNSICDRTENCSQEMEKIGELNLQMKEVIDKLVKETKFRKQIFILENNIELTSIDQIWEEILQFYDANQCYERLNNLPITKNKKTHP